MNARRVSEVGERPEHELVDHVEHRGVGADAEAERENDGRGEAGFPPETADRIANVLLEIVEPGDRPPIASAFPNPGDIPKTAVRNVRGILFSRASCPL